MGESPGVPGVPGAPGEALFDEWAEAQGMEGDPETAVVALRVEGFGAFYASAEDAIDELDTYYPTDESPGRPGPALC